MSESYLMSMPVIINCLGGEMVYILCSRLKAQSISNDKSIRVISDICKTLYDKKFQNELYAHKKPYKHQEVKIIFENLAHSSIMRLNATSMNKLFELMLMTLKLQILRTRYPEEIYQITVNHFEGVLSILKKVNSSNSELESRIQEELLNFKQNYKNLLPYDYIVLKSTILRFLQGKNVKVSVFIQDFLQNNNSILYLPMEEEAPPFVEKPGIVFDNVTNKSEFFELKLSNCFKKSDEKNRRDVLKNTEFGKNMFGLQKLILLGRPPKKEKENEVIDMTKEFEFSKEEKEKNKNDKNENLNNKNLNEELTKDSIIGQDNFLDRLTDEQKSLISKGNKNDFMQLSGLLNSSTHYGGDDVLDIDLFSMNQGFNNNDKKEGSEEYCINIDRKQDLVKNKIDQVFDESNIINKNDQEGEDDLLDLMDKI